MSEGATAAVIKTCKHGLARVTGGRGTAARAMGMLGAMFAFAVRRGLRGDNPVHGVDRHAYEPRQRRMTEAEFAALGEALRTMPKSAWPVAVAATKFLALTGWRRGEMLTLKMVSEVDLVIQDCASGRRRRQATPCVLITGGLCNTPRRHCPALADSVLFPAKRRL